MAKVLAAKHTALLQLLCTVGGNQARLDARTEFVLEAGITISFILRLTPLNQTLLV